MFFVFLIIIIIIIIIIKYSGLGWAGRIWVGLGWLAAQQTWLFFGGGDGLDPTQPSRLGQNRFSP